MSEEKCVVCNEPLRENALRRLYEGRVYSVSSERCKWIFQENPDRYLDAAGGVLPEPR